jgi:hypothetical protein
MEAKDTRLSYSSANLLKNCQQRYWHHKIGGTTPDPDFEDSKEAFNLGHAFHEILETTGHKFILGLQELVKSTCSKHKVEDQSALVHGMVLKYLQLHSRSGLEAISCELELKNDIFLGYADVVFKEVGSTGWWIGDLKTAARYSELLSSKLHLDTQLNLYSYFVPQIAKALDLAVNNYQGARYRVTTKTTIKQKSTESYTDYVKRIYASVTSYDVLIPVERMSPEKVYKDHKKLHDLSLMIREKIVEPSKNFSYCDSFFKACPYWSKCYGCLASEGSGLKVNKL